jgi:hypothetical protein
MSITPTFAGEMQLAGWSESHTGGCKVTFWLQGPDELAAFRALTVRKGNTAGHRFMAALVEIGDDEQPVTTEVVPDVGIPITGKPKGGALAKLAGMWCNEPEFQAWLSTILPKRYPILGPDDAANCLRTICEIDSRAELDSNASAADLFNVYIRGPYSKHLLARGLTA